MTSNNNNDNTTCGNDGNYIFSKCWCHRDNNDSSSFFDAAGQGNNIQPVVNGMIEQNCKQVNLKLWQVAGWLCFSCNFWHRFLWLVHFQIFCGTATATLAATGWLFLRFPCWLLLCWQSLSFFVFEPMHVMPAQPLQLQYLQWLDACSGSMAMWEIPHCPQPQHQKCDHCYATPPIFLEMSWHGAGFFF